MKLRAGFCFLAMMGSLLLFRSEASARGDGVLGWLHKLSGPGPFWGGAVRARAPLNAFELSVSLGLIWRETAHSVSRTEERFRQAAMRVDLADRGELEGLISGAYEPRASDRYDMVTAVEKLLDEVQDQKLSIDPRVRATIDDSLERLKAQLQPASQAQLEVPFDSRISEPTNAAAPQREPQQSIAQEDAATLEQQRADVRRRIDASLDAIREIASALERVGEEIDKKELEGPCRSHLEALDKCRVQHWLGMEFSAQFTREASYRDPRSKTTIWWLATQNYYEYAPTPWLSVSVGYTFNYFSGAEFENFWRGSLTMPRVRFRIHERVSVSAEANYFFKRFTGTDFGGPPVPRPEGGEWVPGISLGYHFGRPR